MMEGLCFYSSKYRVTKGFKFHAQPQIGAYSCLSYGRKWSKIGIEVFSLKGALRSDLNFVFPQELFFHPVY